MKNKNEIYTSGALTPTCSQCLQTLIVTKLPEVCPVCDEPFLEIPEEELKEIDDAHMNTLIRMSNDSMSPMESEFYDNYKKQSDEKH